MNKSPEKTILLKSGAGDSKSSKNRRGLFEGSLRLRKFYKKFFVGIVRFVIVVKKYK